MSEELRVFLTEKGVATSRTTGYNPEGNGQVERYIGIIWLAISTCLKSRHLPVKIGKTSYQMFSILFALSCVRPLMRHLMNVSLVFQGDPLLKVLYLHGFLNVVLFLFKRQV